jgi:outer membrane protein OmpA-like peptidoglycan-associated protein
MTATRGMAAAALALVGAIACTPPTSRREGRLGSGDENESYDEASRRREETLVRQREEIARNEELLNELHRRNLAARTTARGVVVSLPDVLFAFGRTDLTRDARRKTRDVAEVVKRDARGRRIAIEGHTDSIGSAAANRRLSEARAASVADALVKAGIDRHRLRTRGFGETRPIAPNTIGGRDNAEGRAKNRRVEVVIENRRGERPPVPPLGDGERSDHRRPPERRDRFDDRYDDDNRRDPYEDYDDGYRPDGRYDRYR